MKPASNALKALLASRQFFVADLYTFTLNGGTLLRYCAGDADITANGHLYPAGGQTGPYFERDGNKARCHWKIGVEVDTLTFDVIPGAATVQGIPLLSAVRQGVFDGADLQLERAYMPTYGDTAVGTVVMFAGASHRSTRAGRSPPSRSTATCSFSTRICPGTSTRPGA